MFKFRGTSLLFCAPFLLLFSCSIGVGEGVISGVVTVESCELKNEPVRVRPNYFAAEATEESILSITVQEGSDFGEESNGLAIEVLDTTFVSEDLLGVPIQIENQVEGEPNKKIVEMTAYLNNVCNAKHFVVMRAVSGTIVFHSIYAPEVNESQKEINVTFTNVELDGSSENEEIRATLSGNFDFIYSRGRPLQRFP